MVYHSLDLDPVPGFPCSRWLAWSECECPAVLLWPERAATAKVNQPTLALIALSCWSLSVLQASQ